jgi:hypothetical protein
VAATESGTVVAVTQDTIAFVNKSEGSVKRKGASGENPAASGDSLSVGDEITTGSNSRAEIIFADSSVVRLAANSVLTLKAATDTNTELELQAGEIWARILKPLTDESFFSITTSDLSAGVRGTSLRMKRVGKKTDVEVVDSTGKSAETPGVDVTYKDAAGVETKERVLPEEGFSFDAKDRKKNKKKLVMAEVMKDDFVRQNTVEDLVYMNTVRKAVLEGKNPIESVMPKADAKFLAKFDTSRIKSFEERLGKELTATAPKKEEIPFFFTEPTIRERALKFADSGAASSGTTQGTDPLNEILKEVGREVILIEKNREMERVRREIEGQVPDAEKRKDVEKRVELIRKEMTDRVEEWKKEPLPETLGGSGAVE